MEHKQRLADGKYELVRMYDEEPMLKQYYIWQTEEEHKERFCCTPTPSSKMEYSEERWLSFHENMRKALRSDQFIYMLRARETGELLGWACLSDYNPRNRCAEISYYLPPSSRGKGLGTALLASLLQTVFAEGFHWKLHKVFAETGAHNTASIHLLESAGFHLDGRIRDHYWLDGKVYDQLIFTLLASEHANSQPQ